VLTLKENRHLQLYLCLCLTMRMSVPSLKKKKKMEGLLFYFFYSNVYYNYITPGTIEYTNHISPNGKKSCKNTEVWILKFFICN
jgi:hypothetical protein